MEEERTGQRQEPQFIEVYGAKVNNLKNIDAKIPLRKLVAIAGVSGSGKSSLALGVLYAEGSRRYLEALSTYTRRRISQVGAANIDKIEHIPAALVLHQRPAVPDMRSTFGTSTELLNCVRLMFSRLGSHKCPNGHYVPPSRNVALMKPLVCPTCGKTFEGPGAESFAFNSDGACLKCSGTGYIREVDEAKLVPDVTKTLEEGAVEAWNMFGISWMYHVARELGVRTNIPFKDLSAEEKEIIHRGEAVKRTVMIPSKNGKLFELECTYRNAHQAVKEALKRVETEKALGRIEKFLSMQICPECHGTRLNAQARSSLLNQKTLMEVSSLPLSQLITWIKALPEALPAAVRPMSHDICRQFLDISVRLMDLGLDYLSLDRASSTLSTGERQRVQLARAVRNKTTGVLYVLDEPSIGLHPANVEGLLEVVKDLITDGNSVVLVDHDTQVLAETDFLVEMGPGAGAQGGNIIAQGTIPEIRSHKKSLIGPFLDQRAQNVVRHKAPADKIFLQGRIGLSISPIHTVQALQVDIPINRLTVVTGVSGSGKTTLILESLVPAIKAKQDNKPFPAHIQELRADGITKIKLVDATPIGANVRSTVATYSNIHDDLRKLYASTNLAKQQGYATNDFSYNTGKLRCPLCDGTGQISMDMQFLPDVTIACPNCGGHRYAPEAQQITYLFKDKALSLPQLMALTVDEILQQCSPKDKFYTKLQALSEIGLGYLTLGESTPALSGGEAQRLKLSSEMGKSQQGVVFVFDEPTIGLHPLDVQALIQVFQNLLDRGATVIVIEHDLDMMANADYIIDMGPGGGEFGGRIVAYGTPQSIAKTPESITGRYLQRL